MACLFSSWFALVIALVLGWMTLGTSAVLPIGDLEVRDFAVAGCNLGGTSLRSERAEIQGVLEYSAVVMGCDEHDRQRALPPAPGRHGRGALFACLQDCNDTLLTA